MTLDDALELVVAHTHHERFRYLVKLKGGEALIRKLAAEIQGQPPPEVDLDTKLIAAIECCDFRHSTCGCHDKPARCLLGGWPAVVTFEDCKKCILTLQSLQLIN